MVMFVRFPFPPLAACLAITCAFAAPPVIDDQALHENLRTSLGKLAGTDGVPSADDLAKKARDFADDPAAIPLPAPGGPPPPADYESLSRSVFLIGTIFKCGKCDKWHQSGSATAWCVGADGLMVTNAHVFEGAGGAVMGVINREGRCHPVCELLGIDKSSDIAVFRVKGNGLQPLRIGAAPDVGSPVTVISNPAGNCFVRTTGSVARYSNKSLAKGKPKVTWMSITADYAKGSSGGPVFNAAGEVVGMVSSTRSIYTDPGKSKEDPKGHLQMVIKNCVPADSIRALFENPASPGKPAGT